jgi:hypothetical protein
MLSEFRPSIARSVLRWAIGALIWLMAASVASATTSVDVGPYNFTAPILGSAGATCSMSYRLIPPSGTPVNDSVQVVWSCTLNLPPNRYRTVGSSSLGGVLEFQLMSQDSVVAVGRTVTGSMRWGQAYTFSDTLPLTSPVVQRHLEPLWRLTCHGKPMGIISCGPVSRSPQ